MMNFSEKEIRIFNRISLVAGIFTVVIAITMLFSLLQLMTINPLDTPALQSVKAQFDNSPDSKELAEQVRAVDLMSRKAYFSSRWQVETGSYLLLAGAVIFVLFQRLVAGSGKPARSLQPDRPDIASEKTRNRKYLIISAAAVTVLAIVSSFVLRSGLPAPGRASVGDERTGQKLAESASVELSDVNYPFFRGEGSRGIAGGEGYPTEWNGPEGKNIKWKTRIPKMGKNSPVIWGEKLFLTGAGDGKLEIYCLDKNTGEILWTSSGTDFPGASPEEPESDPEAGMAVPTAAVTENAVCAIFGNGNLVCYDHDGKLKWGKNLGVPENIYGFTSSILIYKKVVLVQYDGQNKFSISGYDLETGDLKWETPRSGRLVNSSPVLAIFDGEPQVLINGNPNVTSYDPVSGKELWSLPGVSGDIAPSVGVNSKMVFTGVDYYSVVALKPGKNGSVIWSDNTFTPEVASPVANDECLFVATGYGDVACYNTETGDTLWSHYFKESFYASPIICDNKVWLLDRLGTMHIVDANSKLNIISSSPLGEHTDCTPAFSEKQIFIRGRENLYCISAN